MVVVFNPRQGGFQSVAPSNPIEKAIDKKAPIPQLPSKSNNSNRSNRSNRSNQSTQAVDNLNQPISQNPQITIQNEQAQAKTLAFQNVLKEAEAKQADANFIFTKGKVTGGNYGALIVSQEEATAFEKGGGGYVPYFITSGQDRKTAEVEANIIGETSLSQNEGFFNPGFTRSQLEVNQARLNRAKEISTDLVSFYNNPSEFKGSVGTSVEGGVSYSLDQQFFQDKYFNNEASLKYNKEARNIFEGLPQGTKTRLQTAQEISAITKAGVGALEFGGTVILTTKDYIKSQGFGVITKETTPFAIPKIRDFDLGANSLKAIPNTPSIYSTKDIPLLTGLTGIGLPKGKDTLGYIKEIGSSPEKVINVAGLTYLGGTGIKGIKNARALYLSEIEGGSSRLGALNTLGGETLSNLSPIQIRQRVFISETSLTPFKTTQLNKGDLLTTTKIGELDGNILLRAGEKGITTYTPKNVDYLIYKPKLTNAEFKTGTINIAESQVTKLGNNLFKVKQTDKGFDVTGQGIRNIDVIGERLKQTGKYSLGKEPYFAQYTQEFKTFGQGKQFNLGKELDITVSKSKSKTIESKEYFNGELIKKGKAFDSPISGRPQTSKSIDIYSKSYKIDNQLGTIEFGKSIGKSISGGRKIVTSFDIKTITPNKNYFDFKTLGSNKKVDSGFKVTRVYAKGEFDYLKNPNQFSPVNTQINKAVSTSIKSSTSPIITKLDMGIDSKGLKISQVSKSFQETNIRSSFKTSISLNTRTRLDSRYSLGLQQTNELNAFRLSSRVSQTQIQNPIQVTASSSKQITSSILVPTSVNVPRITDGGFTFRPTNTITFGGIGELPSFGGYLITKNKKRSKSFSGYDISPSFNAIVQNLQIKNPLKVSKTFGVTPFQTRGLLVGKKSKGSYFQLTDI